MAPARPATGDHGRYHGGMNATSPALLALSALASAAVVAAGALVLEHRVAPGEGLLRLVEGPTPDCGGFGVEVLGGPDLDRDGVLAEHEAESSAIVCSVDGRLQLAYEPEALRSAFDEEAPERRRSRVLLDFWDEPAGGACAAGGTGVAAGMDEDEDGMLSEAEIGSERALCSPPAADRVARSR